MDNRDEYPRIETTERGYREFLRTHPKRSQLRKADVPLVSLEMTVIYDHERFSKDASHSRTPSRHAVATRSFDLATKTYVFHILPNGSPQVW